MNKCSKNKISEEDQEQELEDQEELIDQDGNDRIEKIEAHRQKKTHKQRLEKPKLGVTQKLSLATHRTLSTTERLIQSLTRAYEHIFVGNETVEEAKFEKEYALKYYSKNDYKNALKHFESSDAKDEKKDADVLYMMGTCYVSEEEMKKAVECFQQADALKPDDFDILSQLAKCLLALEDYEGALEFFNKTVLIAPDEPDIYYHCANCYEKLDQIELAKKMYRKAIDINPREAVYYHALGFLYENMGDHKDAIVCFKKAMDLERSRGGAMKARE